MWASADREFAQVLLFVSVCVRVTFRICLHLDNMTSHIHVRNVWCATGCTFQRCEYNTESQSLSLEMQSAVGFHSVSFPSMFSVSEKAFFPPPFQFLFSFFSFQWNDVGWFLLAAGEKHLSRSISFPEAFTDRDRWCPFKRSHGSVLFLVLTTHTDTEPHWETHTRTDVDAQWCLHANIHIICRM